MNTEYSNSKIKRKTKTSQQMPVCGIYRIQSSQSDSFYVGSSRNIKKRWHQHVFHLRRGTHHARRLQVAWNEDGESAFFIEVLETVADVDCLRKREDHWVIKLEAFGGPGGCNGNFAVRCLKTNNILSKAKIVDARDPFECLALPYRTLVRNSAAPPSAVQKKILAEMQRWRFDSMKNFIERK